MSDAVPTYDVAFQDLAEIVLEESWVLAIEQRSSAVEFAIEAVLTSRHRDYAPPRPGEMYCYRRGSLIIASNEPPRLRLSGAPPATDATGEQDLDHIDSFVALEIGGRDIWELEGTWGELQVTGPSVSLVLGDEAG